jgi:REP element-mobilizing transposase RayT
MLTRMRDCSRFLFPKDGAVHELAAHMARHKRIQTPGLFRHVIARGNGRMRIFVDDLDFTKFIHLMADIVERFEVECWNYCLMPNHYHLTLRPSRPNLSETVRYLNGSYGLWWNRRHDRVGHVFQGRFKDQIVQRHDYLLVLGRYIALNPVRAELVTRPEQWKWSSYAGTAGLAPAPPFVAVSSVLQLFGEGEPDTLQTRFANYVMGPTAEDQTENRIRSTERVLGDALFKKSVRRGGINRPNDIAETSPPGFTNRGIDIEAAPV